MDGFLRLFLVSLIAFFSGLISSIFGGGYGTILTPALILMGYEREVVVPCTLVSQLISGLFLVAMHHKLGTIRLSTGSEDLKVASALAACGLFGLAIAALALLVLPGDVVDAYVGLMVLAVGLVVLFKRNSRPEQNGSSGLGKLVVVGVLSAFNKGLSGGGYGPLLSGGQVAVGTRARSAIGRTAIMNIMVCLGGVLLYIILGFEFDIWLVLSATVGLSLMTPLSAYTVKRTGEKKLRTGMGLVITVLGIGMLIKLLLG